MFQYVWAVRNLFVITTDLYKFYISSGHYRVLFIKTTDNTKQPKVDLIFPLTFDGK